MESLIQDIPRKIRGKFNKDLLLNTYFEHTELFSPAANKFLKEGKYCGEVYNSKKYNIFWSQEEERCLYGYENPITKLWIPGKYYHFLNYKQMKTVEKGVAVSKRVTSFPNFWPIHYFFACDYNLAITNGLNLAILKPRGTGFSELMASFGVHEYTFQTETPVFYFVAVERYLNKDGVLSKAWDQINFHNASTERAFKHLRQFKDQDLYKKASFLDPETGAEVKTGGEIQGAVIDHPRKLRGARGFVNFEEGGSFPNLESSWMTAKALAEEGGVKFSMMCVWGTGGEQGPGIAGLENIFGNPDVFDCLPFENCWEESLLPKDHGFFFPAWANMTRFMDKWGNTDFDKAKQYHDQQREKAAKGSSNLMDKQIAEYPYCIHPDSWVSHEKLGLIQIKDVQEKYDNGIQDRYILKTKKGREIISTNTHFYFNGKDYIRLKDMKSGDSIQFLPITFNTEYQEVEIKTSLNCFTTKIKIDEEWARFLGLYMGDGCLHGNGSSHTLSLVFDIKDKESYTWSKYFLEKIFKGVTERNPSKGSIELRVNSNLIGFIFKELQLVKVLENGQLKRNVHVPNYIIKSPKSVVKEFLSGVFDSDGCAYKTVKRVTMYTKHNQFLQDIQMLLSGFGINAKRRTQKKINGEGRQYDGQSLELDSYFVDIFKKDIRFISNRKNGVIDSFTNLSKPTKDYNQDFVESIEFHSTGQVYDLTTEKGYYSVIGLHVHNTPMEALMRLNNNPFPVEKLQRHLRMIDSSPDVSGILKKGEFEVEEGQIVFKLNHKLVQVDHYPHKTDEALEGAFIMFESALRDDNGKVPDNLYYIVADCFYQDLDQTTQWNSLGSFYVYKKINTLFPTEDDILVGWYAGRPPRAKDFHRRVFLAARYYNAVVQTEIKGGGNDLLNYAKQYGFLNYCGDRPTVFNHSREHKKISGREFFIRVEESNKPELIQKFVDWLLKERSIKINGENTQYVLNLEKIYDRALLEELIKYSPNGNFDRISCMLVLMAILQEAELQVVEQQTKQGRDHIFSRSLYSDSSDYREHKLQMHEMLSVVNSAQTRRDPTDLLM